MHIATHINRHYISTSYLEAMNLYETMVFEYTGASKDKIDWSGKETWRTKSKAQAIKQHCEAVASYAKNA